MDFYQIFKYMKGCAAIAVILLLSSCSTKKRANAQVAVSSNAQWEIGVALYSFRQSSFAKSLDKAKIVGAKYVEGFFFQQLGDDFDGRQLVELSDGQLKKIGKMVRDRGLKMRSMYAGAETNSEWKQVFKIGQQLGLDFLVGEPRRTQLDFVDSLAGAYDMRLALHEHPKGQSIYWHPDSVLAALQGRPHIGACADIGHWVRSGLDPVKSLKELAGHLISLHVKNVAQAGEVDANYVNLNKGVIDYEAVVDVLRRQDFSGPAYVEYEREGPDNVDNIRSAVNYLYRLRDERSK